MPLGTLERSAPPFFKQGPSALSRLAVFSALALFLMVADARFQITGPFRQAVATVLYPVQWLMLQPVEFASHGRSYFQSLQTAQDDLDAVRKKMTVMGQRANQADQLAMENQRLRKLLELRDRLETPAQAAEGIYDTAHPGVRGVAYGDRVAGHGGGMELRFMPANADIREDDLLTTSGVDGLYPPGLPVARVVRVERRADSAFARIYCMPLAQVRGARHVVVLKPLADNELARPEPAPAVPANKRGGRK